MRRECQWIRSCLSCSDFLPKSVTNAFETFPLRCAANWFHSITLLSPLIDFNALNGKINSPREEEREREKTLIIFMLNWKLQIQQCYNEKFSIRTTACPVANNSSILSLSLPRFIFSFNVVNYSIWNWIARRRVSTAPFDGTKKLFRFFLIQASWKKRACWIFWLIDFSLLSDLDHEMFVIAEINRWGKGSERHGFKSHSMAINHRC
jgi:hypothetical protein